MIALIIKSYLTLFLSVGIGSIFLVIIGLIFIFKTIAKPSSSLSIKASAEEIQFIHEKNTHISPCDDDHSHIINNVAAIAGDNFISTQLDLARAYIETDKKLLAKKILDNILEQGSHLQKQEAQQLLHFISPS